MNEVGEIMATNDTSTEVQGPKPSEVGRNAASAKEGDNREPESLATLDDVQRSREMLVKDPNQPINELPEESAENVLKELKELDGEKANKEDNSEMEPEDKRDKEEEKKEKEPKDEEERDEIDELLEKEREADAEKPTELLQKELDELLVEYVEFLGDGADEKLLEETAGNKKAKSKNRTKEMMEDIAAQFKKILFIILKIIKRAISRDLLPKEEKEKNEMTGEEIGLSDEPFEGEENEREALKQGLKKKSHQQLVKEFNREKGDQSVILSAADRIFSEKLFKMKAEKAPDVEEIVTKNKLLHGKIANKRAELMRRAIAKKAKA